MKKIWQWVKDHLLWFKIIFIASILFFVVNQLSRILQGMTWHKFMTLLQQQGAMSILSMMILGCVAATPMILYDVATTRLLKTKITTRSLLKEGWIINTINNLVGFGGVVGVTLRANRYMEKEKTKDAIADITKSTLFLLSGLSTLCLIMLGVIYLVPSEAMYRSYTLWLLLGSGYVVLLLLFVARSRKFFRDFSKRTLATFYLASLGQWTGALGIFLWIGYQITKETSIIQIAPLFVVATLIGMLTMVPGGMGTFDVLMILGLNSLGISKEIALMWLLFYRLFYYVIPFISGLILFTKETGTKINRLFAGLPSRFFSKVSHRFVSVILYGSGILMIILSAIPNLSAVSQVVNYIFPFSMHFFDQALNMIVGLLLIGLARGVNDQVKKAYRASLLLLIFCFINTVLATRSWQLMLFFVVTFLLLYLSRHQFYRERFVYSWSALLLDSTIFLFIFIFYGVIGYFTSNVQQGPTLKFWLFPSEKIWFQGLIGLLVAILILVALYHYLSSDVPFGEAYQEQYFLPLAKKYGCDRYQQLAYTGEYRHFYYQKENQIQVILTFFIRANRCILLSTPLGEEKYWKEAMESFMMQADINDYQVVALFANQKFSLALHELGFKFMNIGEEGFAIAQKVKEKSLDFTEISKEEWVEEYPMLSSCLRKKVSDYPAPKDFWLKKEVLEQNTILAFGPKEARVGYAVITENEQYYSVLGIFTEQEEKEQTVEILQALEQIAQQKGKQLSLEFSPLANVGNSSYAFLEEKWIHVIYNFGNMMTNFEQQRQRLAPYVNEWHHRYLCYRGHQPFIFLLIQCFFRLGKK